MRGCRNYRSVFPLTPKELRRFAARLEEDPDGCWLWTGPLDPEGYGRFVLRGSIWQAHRMAYELLIGPVPHGCVLHHRCCNKRCCNPAHLQPVTQAVNCALDGVRGKVVKRLKTHCRNGHEFSGDNLGWRVIRGKRMRVCRTCAAATARRGNERRRLLRASAALNSSAAGASGTLVEPEKASSPLAPAAGDRVVDTQLGGTTCAGF